MIALRKAHPALTLGRLEWLRNSDESRVVTFARRDEAEDLVVAINFSNRPFAGIVERTDGAAYTDITPDPREPLKADATDAERAARARAVNLPSLSLDAWGYRIFRRGSGPR
jgi:glycosidase